MLVVISQDVHIESGPPRKRAIATPALLDDKVTHEKYQVGALDSYNKPIVLGEMMDYVDWYAPPEAHVFNVYRMNPGTGRHDIMSIHPSLEEARASAEALIAKEGIGG